jgi:hypothetical protein
MKKLIILIIAVQCSLLTVHLFAQSCLPNGITFSSQVVIDNFHINYPGCTDIEGDVTIWGDDITSLNGLSVLTSIGANLEIKFNHALIDLEGLGNLTSIGGEFILYYNNSLTSLTGLGNIDPGSISNLEIAENKNLTNCEVQTVCAYLADPKGTVNIYNNGAGCNNPREISDACGITLPCLPYGNYYLLTQADIDNFQVNYPGCTEIEGDVTIYGGGITNLDSLNCITSIAGTLTIGERWHYSGGNPNLENLSGLMNLTTIGQDLIIWQNHLLPSLTGLENLKTVEGDFWIGDNPSINSLISLNNLTSVGGDFSIWGEALNSLHGLSNLTSVGGNFGISGGTFTDLNELINLTSIGGLDIGPCDSLTSLTGLENITTVDGNVSIDGCMFWWGAGNPYLTSLSGLNNLTSIGGNLEISGNAALVDLSGLEKLTSVRGDVIIGMDGDGGTICDNPSLNSFIGLNQLDSVGGSFSIHYNDTLSTLSGLEKLSVIGEDLRIVDNPTLNSLMGLKSLKSVGGELLIGSWHLNDYANSTLVSLDGLENIDPHSISDLRITFNTALAECDILSICNYLVSPNGTVEIHDNAPGCNSQEEVAEACAIGVAESSAFSLQSSVTLCPNPISGVSSFRFQVSSIGHVTLKIYDLHGREVATVVDQQLPAGEHVVSFDASGLPPGIYIWRQLAAERSDVPTRSGLGVGKLIKL